MAPVFNVLVQLLPSLARMPKSPASIKSPDHQSSVLELDHQQHRLIDAKQVGYGNDNAVASAGSTISAVSWAKNRLDVFGLTANNLTHKYWDGYQWNPSNKKVESLGNGLSTPPVAVTWGVDRLDLFGLDDNNVLKHQYWDGVAWRPDVATLENLAPGCDPNYPISANTWGQDRLDIFCTGPKGDLLHQYYDGSQWQPSVTSLESLGGSLGSGPSIISWGSDRLDIFGVDPNGDLAHLYWDGHQWSGWETFPFLPQFGLKANGLSVSSWGINRLDVWGVAFDNSLYHKYWDGYQWSPWENLGGELLQGRVAATSWSANRLDIVARGGEGKNYFYKYYDGQAWRPDAIGWYNKGPAYTFNSDPSAVSWGQNRLDIFGTDTYDNLLHQTWVGDSWYPDPATWETLSGSDNLTVVDDEAGVADCWGSAGTELRK